MAGFPEARKAADQRLADAGMGRNGAPAAPAAEQAKQPMRDVNYRAAGDDGTSCGSCMYFQSDSNSCELVEGVIDPMATCDLFKPAQSPSAPAEGSMSGAPPAPPA